MGLCNGPPTCQRLMELVLNGLQWQICLIYLDDVIVFGSSFSEHMQRLETVLQRILDAGLKLKPEKCTLLKPEVTFLGNVVSQKGMQAKIIFWLYYRGLAVFLFVIFFLDSTMRNLWC